MNTQEFRKVLEKAEDRFSLLADPQIFNQYEFYGLEQFYELVEDFLSEEEIAQLFNYSHFEKMDTYMKTGIFDLISDENIQLQVLSNEKFRNGYKSVQIQLMLERTSDDVRQKALNINSIAEHLEKDDRNRIVNSLSDEGKKRILRNQDFIEKYELSVSRIEMIMSELEDKSKIELLTDKEWITEKVVLEKENIKNILLSFEGNVLTDFMKNNRDFLQENDIHPYEVVNCLNSEQQKDFVSKLENIGLELNEKREILAILKEDVKQSIDTTNFPEEYKSAINMKVDFGIIVLDLERNLEDYRGLDSLIRVFPEEILQLMEDTENKTKFMQLCDICPNLKVQNAVSGYIDPKKNSSGLEFKEAEKWIESVMNSLDPNHSKVQKMAIIDHAIGKKISYSPDFDTEVFDKNGNRSIWKMICTGYGVCNGISALEQYMFARAGIESQTINGKDHSYVWVKDIELCLDNGETVKGDTLVDPTWNLSAHRFDAFPDNFCMSYEEIRKQDVPLKGWDDKYHYNEKLEGKPFLNLGRQGIRNVYKSVGLTREDGRFPVTDLMEKSNEIDEKYRDNPSENIKQQFSLLEENCPEFANYQAESTWILSVLLLKHEHLKLKKCVVKRVFDKQDSAKRPILYVYMDSPQMGRKFYYADKEQGQMVELPEEKFTERFECYQEDLEGMKGIRPWETEKSRENAVNLAMSSGTSMKGEDR